MKANSRRSAPERPSNARAVASAVLVTALGCAGPSVHSRAELELVESVPSETALDHPELRDATVVWLEMIGRAERTLDMAFFYGSRADGAGLDPVLEAIESAAARGVRVRVLFDQAFTARESSVLDRWSGGDTGIELRVVDFGAIAGGVMHAKYFVVDDEHVFVGSQNLDWRALEHIVELGVRVREPEIGAAFARVFARDWAAAGGDRIRDRARPRDALIEVDGAKHRVSARFSPRGEVGHPEAWDWPELRAAIDGARRSVDVQALSYSIRMRDGRPWRGLDGALRRAAARGVRVRVLVSEWNLRRPEDVRTLRAADGADGIDVRVVRIPEHSSGPIPYARVSHRKIVVVDELMAWVGSSNFSGDYFERSRNAGLIVRGETVPARVGALFEEAWGAAEPLP